VVIANIEANESKELRTDSTGCLVHPYLLPGRCSISVEKAGLRMVRQENVNLDVGHTPAVDFVLEAGGCRGSQHSGRAAGRRSARLACLWRRNGRDGV
jgi:hypothetical protein